jgi:hypothetical protein
LGAGVAMLLATEAEKWWGRRALTRPDGSMHL